LFSESTRILIDAMERNRVKRLVETQADWKKRTTLTEYFRPLQEPNRRPLIHIWDDESRMCINPVREPADEELDPQNDKQNHRS
jgi:hypothetical protein